jgi:hypothetical protein
VTPSPGELPACDPALMSSESSTSTEDRRSARQASTARLWAAERELMASAARPAPAMFALLGVKEMAGRIIPAERAVLLLSVSREVREAVESVRPAAQVKAKRGQGMETVESGLSALSRWCRITALDLSSLSIEAEGAGRLAAVLGQCTSLARLNLWALPTSFNLGEGTLGLA